MTELRGQAGPGREHEPATSTGETRTERLARNWGDILQELRVIQTGTQILTGFLLTLAFQPRFTDLDAYQQDLYLVLVAGAVLTTALSFTPVVIHRSLFRSGAKDRVVHLGNRLLIATLVAVGLVLTGAVMLIVDVVLGRVPGFIAGGAALVLIAGFWLIVPRIAARGRHREVVEDEDEPA